MAMPPTWEKGSHLTPGTTKLGKLRDGYDSTTAPTAKPDLGSSSLLGECRSVEPTQGCQKCDSSVSVQRYTRWTGKLSHQTSNLSYCYVGQYGGRELEISHRFYLSF